MKRLKGLYVTDNSSLVVDVISCGYYNEEYAKIKINLYSKSGLLYESRKNYKVWWKNIEHWRRMCED